MSAHTSRTLTIYTALASPCTAHAEPAHSYRGC